jgi:hypothetical protein
MVPEDGPYVVETCCNTEWMYKFNDILKYLTSTFGVLNVFFSVLMTFYDI